MYDTYLCHFLMHHKHLFSLRIFEPRERCFAYVLDQKGEDGEIKGQKNLLTCNEEFEMYTA